MFKDLKKYMTIRLYLIMYFFTPLICNSSINLKVEGLNSELDYNVRQKLLNIHTNVKHIDSDLKKK
ncbi:hypothetical protein [Blochmannia endosymbiont of Camponotus modoc]|uniref:hypothetical protein n=1 Tax=Blochmannia endosymbiont of Camponotus modoc TaxID=2945587 RepID=UPI00202491E2|nr:hypothetical protein [Blochmannia endosymbiont of Camponotus modoc]URJ26112.1 hypothetical protein M9396_02010 [Blochmannia endosymbiont of Camponotus modoc]URJ31850.1 hypothetical protein M9395_00485 [Blochmannia endosymbiont of Camponotus modoc]